MAKINLTNQHDQEENLKYLEALASLGVLVCMVVTIVGIKLWWFKHRLSFEQNGNAQGGGAKVGHGGIGTPSVIVPRRSKRQKYKRDKRYSQQIYESVEVHGVFRQKCEDDLVIQRPQQLPPVGIRQLSESSSSLILPPLRHKRREQIHSTAFEDLEIATPPLINASSSDLPVSNSKISLTFEEFESQFKLKEIKAAQAKAPPHNSLNNKVTELPIPPLRLNRSSSAMASPEKSQRILKSSQSITMPGLHKVIEKRLDHSSVSRGTQDLTKLDEDYNDEPKLFETFGERRPTGYIKYEEVDSDLQDQYEKELNEETNKLDYCESPKVEPNLNALRNEYIIYINNLNESPDNQYTEEFKFNKTCFELNELEDVEYKEDVFGNFTHEKKEFSENLNHISPDKVFAAKYQTINQQEPREVPKDEAKLKEEHLNTQFKAVKEGENIEMAKRSYDAEFHSVNEPVAKEFVKESSLVKQSKNKDFLNEPQILQREEKRRKQNSKNVKKEKAAALQVSKEYASVSKSLKETKTNGNSDTFESFSFQEDFDQPFSWPQFEEKIVTPKVVVRKFNKQDLEAQNSFEETDHYSVIDTERATEFDPNHTRPTDLPEVGELKDFDNKFYHKIRSFITTENFKKLENQKVTFDSQDSDSEDPNNSVIKQRRPTGYVKNNEYSVKYESNENGDLRNSIKNDCLKVKINEIPSKVSFEESYKTEEKFTLNQRRPTGFVKDPKRKESCSSLEDCKDFSPMQVKFDETTINDQQDHSDSHIKQRRPTGYTKKLEILDLRDEISSSHQGHLTALSKEYNETKELFLNSHRVRSEREEYNSIDHRNNTKFLLKQRRPTAFIPKEEHTQMEKQVNFQLNVEDIDTISGKENEALKQRRPTGFIRKEEISKQVPKGEQTQMEKQVNFQINDEDIDTISGKENEALKQRRPTGFIRKEEISKQVNFHLNQNSDDDDETSEFGNEQLKQRRPTGFVRKQEFESLDALNNNDFDEHLWEELQNDVAADFTNNFEAEFTKIRHSYELNEADFLEPKDNTPTTPLGFGQSIEDDWDNFEKLKDSNNSNQLVAGPQEIQTTFRESENAAKSFSILRDYKLDEDIPAKPRKSKVTFDFKTEERVIPARKSHNYSEEDSTSEEDDDVYDKSQLSMPPQPMQRVSKINYNTETTLTPLVAIPTAISLFGNQRAQQDNSEEDTWSIIRKHRTMIAEFQSLSTDSQHHSPTPSPPKPSYRNPLAQLAVQRAKEARADMEGYKSRSINNNKKRSEGSKKQKQSIFNMSNDDYGATDA